MASGCEIQAVQICMLSRPGKGRQRSTISQTVTPSE
jgi:hypothetical protein